MLQIQINKYFSLDVKNISTLININISELITFIIMINEVSWSK